MTVKNWQCVSDYPRTVLSLKWVQLNKIDVLPGVGGSILGILYDICYLGIIRGTYLKVLTTFFGHEIHAHSK